MTTIPTMAAMTIAAFAPVENLSHSDSPRLGGMAVEVGGGRGIELVITEVIWLMMGVGV